ncbi:U3 small nucleolar RNA-interacting protein 2 [Cylas formicarius]|uniref:U3 small nucleolar RNA-interacting protein 2 n=1 Tax=Cylas formicarius TaxID=197179 RepID=UPI0029583354|nr:U3 small nucleolar RNA-interacting protein 2 [Cylas formicarius]
MPFLAKGKRMNGIKRSKFLSKNDNNSNVTKKRPKNEEVTSSEDEEVTKDDENDAISSSEDENETAQEKKLRLAKLYLQEIEKEEKARLEQEEIEPDVISKRLRQDYLKESGKLRLSVADKYKGVDYSGVKILRCRQQRNSLTCFCLSSDDKYVFVGSKDGIVVKYSLRDGAKVGLIPFTRRNEGEVVGHSSEILSLAISTDSKFLTVGDKSGNIQIWDPATFKHVKTLMGHKSWVTGLAFKKETHTLYSCSKDKTVKVWNLDEMSYVESLFGHQDMVASIDTLYRDRVVTSGGHDLRVWKITEETQLIYNGHTGNIDNVRLINEENFITGGDDGQICVWSILRKKPLQCIERAHGENEGNHQANWITAVCGLMNTDLFASGSKDGFVRMWKLDNGFKSNKEILKVKVEGFVNSIAFTSDGQYLLVAVSREYRFGRWDCVKDAKNCVLVIPFLLE